MEVSLKMRCGIFIFAFISLVHTSAFFLDFSISGLVQQITDLLDFTDTPVLLDLLIKKVHNFLFGLPPTIALRVVSEICSAIDARAPLHLRPQKDKMKLVLHSSFGKSYHPLTEVRKLLFDADFDADKKIVIYASGWTSDESDTSRRILGEAYAVRGDTNYLTLDSANYIRTLYFWSATNTDNIGRFLAESLADLRISIATDQFHLIGYSLGAQIVGAAARYYRDLTGETLPHVTGLDPAMPCFTEKDTLTTISASDADFVDIIHTSPGVLGHPDATGTADFYVGGKFPIQDNCIGIYCSHVRSWQYYAESVWPGNELNFMAQRCSSLLFYKLGLCGCIEQPMGYAVPHDIEGDFFLEVNAYPPFGQNAPQVPRYIDQY